MGWDGAGLNIGVSGGGMRGTTTCVRFVIRENLLLELLLKLYFGYVMVGIVRSLFSIATNSILTTLGASAIYLLAMESSFEKRLKTVKNQS